MTNFGILEWKLVYLHGVDKLLEYPASQGDPDFVFYWNMAQAEPEVFSVSNTGKGIKMMQEDRVVTLNTDLILNHFLINNPPTERIETFQAGLPLNEYMIITWNSPLGPILKRQMEKLREDGTIKREIIRMNGGKTLSVPQEFSVALTAGQLILIFIVFGSFIGLAGIMVFAEKIFKTFQKDFQDFPERFEI